MLCGVHAWSISNISVWGYTKLKTISLFNDIGTSLFSSSLLAKLGNKMSLQECIPKSLLCYNLWHYQYTRESKLCFTGQINMKKQSSHSLHCYYKLHSTFKVFFFYILYKASHYKLDKKCRIIAHCSRWGEVDGIMLIKW